MAPAKPETIWRRTIKRQLEYSNLPTSNEMAYRCYVSVIFNIARKSGLGTDLRKISRTGLYKAVRNFLIASPSQPWEYDLIWYCTALLMDSSEDRETPAFAGASMICGECGLPVKINEEGDRYVCLHCNAQVKAGPNRIPKGIPVGSEIRNERRRLHERLDLVFGQDRFSSFVRNRYYLFIANFLGKPIEHTHIGFITTKGEVVMWDMAIDNLLKNQGAI